MVNLTRWTVASPSTWPRLQGFTMLDDHSHKTLPVNQFATWILIRNAVKEEWLGSRATCNPLLFKRTCVGYKATPKSSPLWAEMVPVQWNWTFWKKSYSTYSLSSKVSLKAVLWEFGSINPMTLEMVFKKNYESSFFIVTWRRKPQSGIGNLKLSVEVVYLKNVMKYAFRRVSTGFTMILPPPKQYSKIPCDIALVLVALFGILVVVYSNPCNQQK